MVESANKAILNYIEAKGKIITLRISPVSLVITANIPLFLLFAIYFASFRGSRIPLGDWPTGADKVRFDAGSVMK